MSKKKLEAAKLALKKAKEALKNIKKKPKPKPIKKPKPKPRKTKAPIELRGGAKTNPNNPAATRKIAQVAQNPNLRGREKTLAIQEAIRGVRSPTRKRGSSKPEVGLAFREMYRAGKKPVRTKGGKILTDERGGPVVKKPRKPRKPKKKKRGK
jgi:hypothetical protein|tara:strand:+ start:287 stop:745 length:459 start_codon:yes stop_codon:yes gene_type:complete